MENMSKLRKKSFTIVERACHEVRGFRSLLQDLDDKVRLSGHSLSTLKSYSRKLAALSLHFGKLPQNISDKEGNKYLAQLARQSKYNKDRYVPLSPLILKALRVYFRACQPVEFLFNGHEPDALLSVRGMQWALREAVKKCKLQKGITLHTLRHSYATHLLEYGMDIVSIKELLGHERIETTMVYLHVAKPNRTNLFSPLDRLYEDTDQKE